MKKASWTAVHMLKRLLKLEFATDSYVTNFIIATVILTALFLLVFNIIYYSVALEHQRDSFIERQNVDVQILAEHLSTPVGTGRYQTVEQILCSETKNHNVAAVYFFSYSGKFELGFVGSKAVKKMQPLETYEYLFESPVTFANVSVGRIVRIVSFKTVYDSFINRFFSSILANVVACTLIVLLIMTIIAKSLLRPLRHLAQTATRVRVERAYSVRAKKEGIGELAELTDAFNSMLDHIEQHDMVQHSESRNLEKEVLERTVKLEEAIEQAKSANHAKSEFIASVSHELRTPMNAILGMTNMLQTTNLTNKQREYAEVIASASQSLLHLINGVLDLSKLEAKKLEIEETVFTLRDSLDELAVIFTEKVAVKNMDLVVTIAEGVPPVMRGDSFRLKQILLNLVGNAFKFADKGVIEVLVAVSDPPARPAAVQEQSANDEIVQLSFTVKDKGIGIAPEVQEKLFDTFVQADGSMSRRYGGTGLGLSIVAELVELMKGTISLESFPEKGSIFSVTLPFAVAKADRAHDTLSIEGKRVLVLEPNTAARSMWRSLCDELNMQATVVATEKQALMQVKVHVDSGKGFDVLILGCKERLDMNSALMVFLCRNKEQLPPIFVAARLGDDSLPSSTCPLPVVSFLRRPMIFNQFKQKMLFALGGSDPQKDAEFRYAHSLAGLTVLVVEDNKINQQVLREILEYAGVQATIAKDGATALELLSIHEYDLVLMDVQLPEMDGFETTHRIRTELNLTRLPVVAMTAHTLQEDRNKAIAAGMDDYLTKPVELEALVAVLKKFDLRPVLEKTEQMEISIVSKPPGLPEYLPGLNVAEGLERLNGKKSIYVSILKTFVETYRSAVVEMRLLLAAQDFNMLAIKAHTLAGASGNVSAVDVHSYCIAIERGARESSVDSTMLDALEAAIEIACTSALMLQNEIREMSE